MAGPADNLQIACSSPYIQGEMSAQVQMTTLVEDHRIISTINPNDPLPPKSLLSLPSEIINSIISFLDRPSALAFASAASIVRARSGISRACDKVIWRDLDVLPNLNYGRIPLVKPVEGADDIAAIYAKVKCEEEQGFRLGVAEALKAMLSKGDKRKWGLVKSVTVMSLPGSVYRYLHILDMASTSLQTLHIQKPFFDRFVQSLYPKLHETLDVKWLDCKVTFPNLTTICLGYMAVRFSDFVTLLLNSAPNVTRLEADLRSHFLAPQQWQDYPLPNFPRLSTPTRLTDLSLNFGPVDRDDDVSSYSTPLALLEQSPLLQRLSIACQVGSSYPDEDLHLEEPDSDEIDPLHIRVLAALKKCGDLSDLCCRGRLAEMDLAGTEPEEAFCSLKRLLCSEAVRIYEMVCRTHGYPLMIQLEDPLRSGIPALPNLEIMYLDPRRNSSERPVCQLAAAAGDRLPFAVQHMRSSFAAALRAAPRLQLLQDCTHDRGIRFGVDGRPINEAGDLAMFGRLDRLETSGEVVIGRIRSYIHDGAELLHVRLLLQKVQGKQWDPLAVISQYDAPSIGRAPLYEILSMPTWLDFTEYDGATVPRRVLRKMQRVEGVSDEEWAKRGVEVGAKAWQVLLDWRESVRPAE